MDARDLFHARLRSRSYVSVGATAELPDGTVVEVTIRRLPEHESPEKLDIIRDMLLSQHCDEIDTYEA